LKQSTRRRILAAGMEFIPHNDTPPKRRARWILISSVLIALTCVALVIALRDDSPVSILHTYFSQKSVGLFDPVLEVTNNSAKWVTIEKLQLIEITSSGATNLFGFAYNDIQLGAHSKNLTSILIPRSDKWPSQWYWQGTICQEPTGLTYQWTRLRCFFEDAKFRRSVIAFARSHGYLPDDHFTVKDPFKSAVFHSNTNNLK
jgi:hypothetical protein